MRRYLKRKRALTTTTAITTRQQLIEYTTSEWNTFVSCIDGLTEAKWTSPVDLAGWSVKDHVAHVTQWDIAVIELFRNGVPMRRTLGLAGDIWSPDEYDPLNEQLRQRTIADPVGKVRANRDATWMALISTLETMSDSVLAAPATESGLNVDDTTNRSLLQELVAYLGGHYVAHLGYIKLIAGDLGGVD
ncbi:hypothetical protein BH24CHL4_BH24CHL4_16770 [soil metagenome]